MQYLWNMLPSHICSCSDLILSDLWWKHAYEGFYARNIVYKSGIDNVDFVTIKTIILLLYYIVWFQTGASREVTHLQFISWPDYGVPHSAGAFLDFLFHVRDVQTNHVRQMGPAWVGHPLGPPIVVHCSAGIGRTGIVPHLSTLVYFARTRVWGRPQPPFRPVQRHSFQIFHRFATSLQLQVFRYQTIEDYNSRLRIIRLQLGWETWFDFVHKPT